ncbi:MAG TPA: Ku protein [Polyangiaceae bacterium]|jgi:DNA end-binding protein Ku|nr:Ku protein [Polyangiaceae bacterium]
MASRAIGSGTISFGLVSIPVKLYTATSPQRVGFNFLHEKCGTRVKMQYYCPFDQEVVTRQDMIKGYEHAKDRFVTFTDEELKKLEAERTDRVDIVEFVDEASLDSIYIESTYYLGPDKGGDRAYRLLADAMKRTGKVALGRFGRSGKQHLVALRPYRDALVLQQLYYADEVHSIDDVNFPRNVAFRPVEEELADKLVEQLSTDKFEPEKYHDEYRDRVETAVEQKVSGQEISIAPEQPAAQIIDLFEALKRSLGNKPSAGAQNDQEAPSLAAVASSELSMDKPLKKAAPARKTGREKEKKPA